MMPKSMKGSFQEVLVRQPQVELLLARNADRYADPITCGGMGTRLLTLHRHRAGVRWSVSGVVLRY